MSYTPNFDYSQTIWMKMYLATPDFKNNRSIVKIDFEQALEHIKRVDNITQGLKKIVYLVGWQGLGHDDCYPEMEKVNDYLKRDCDKDGRESLLWLFNEAKKYNTVISFHGNVADEYSANASHQEFVEANALCNGPDGKPAVIEYFNDREAYKTSYKQYWESGLFKKYFDRFCEAVPVREAGTVHLDNFCIAESLNPKTYVEEQNEARNAMLDYVNSLGIDVTSEYTYREEHFRAEDPSHPIRKMLYSKSGERLTPVSKAAAPIRALGRILGSFWMSNMSPRECLEIKPSLYAGRLTDRSLLRVFYGCMHGEEIWAEYGNDPEKWIPGFLKEFCTMQVPYMYLSRHDRISIKEDPSCVSDERYTAEFSDGIVSRAKDMSITKNSIVLKSMNDVILPIDASNRVFVAYSELGLSGKWNIPDAAFGEADVFEITGDGNKFAKHVKNSNGTIELDIKPGQAFAIIG